MEERLEACSDPLRRAASARIVERLDEARRLLGSGSPEDLDAFCDVLSGAVDQARAWAAARSAADEGSSTITASRLAFAALASDAADPTSEFLLIPFGEVEVERPLSGESFAFTRERGERIVEWFQRLDRKLAIDYEHQSFSRFNTRADGLSPAAGWIGGLELRDDGLWAVDVSWTERAAELLRSGEYRYFSPVIFWSDEQRTTVAGLGPVALTNDPAMRGVKSLAARRDGEATSEPETAGADGVEMTVAAREDVLERRLAQARRETQQLREELHAREAEGFVERGLREGKITAATRDDWCEDFLLDSKRAEARLRRAPVLLPPGRIVTTSAMRGRSLVDGSPARLARDGVDSADLEAFERALAAGCVQSLSAGRD